MDDDMRSMHPLDTQPNEEYKDDGAGGKFLQVNNNKSFKSGNGAQQNFIDDSYTERSMRGGGGNLAMSMRGNEEIIVPAHNMKKPIDFNTVDDQDFQGTGQNNV